MANVLGKYDYNELNSAKPISVDLSGPNSLVSSNWSSNYVISINAGSDFTCAIMDNRESLCWGKSAQTESVNPSVNTVISSGDIGRHPAIVLDDNNLWNIAYLIYAQIPLLLHLHIHSDLYLHSFHQR